MGFDDPDRIWDAMINAVNQAIIKSKMVQNDSGYLVPFVLTQHEQDALHAADQLLMQQWDEFSTSLSPVDPLDVNTFNAYSALVQHNEVLFRWAVLLHDIGKERQYLFNEDLPHPELSCRITEEISGYLIEYTKDIVHEGVNYSLNKDSLDKVRLLVGYHDALGNIYSGERNPDILDNIFNYFKNQNDSHNVFNILLAVTLCDVRSIQDGKYLTEKRAAYWMDLSNDSFRETEKKNRLQRMIQRWTSDLFGMPDYSKEMALYSNLSPSVFKFLKELRYVVYGYYLFISLDHIHLTGLLNQIAEYADKSSIAPCEIQFSAYKPWEKSTHDILKAYHESIASNSLIFIYNPASKRLKINPCL